MRNPKRIRLLIVAFVAFGVFLAFGSYLAIAAYRWVSDLPNRIVVSVDDKELGRAIVAAMELTLREGPKPQRLEAIKVLAEAGADAAPFEPVLNELTSDPDPEISAAANDAIERIQASETAPQSSPSGDQP